VSLRARIAARVRARVVEPILLLLRQGITPDKVALSIAFGIGLGIIPILGVSTLLCAAVALVLRLNLPAIQLVNYLAAPVQLALIIPFVRFGEALVNAPAQPLSVAAGLQLIAAGPLDAVIVLWDAIVHAAIGYAVAGPLIIYALYRGLRPVLERAARRPPPEPASPPSSTLPDHPT
jgi:uncharacterized protein (DUF2062 family)